MTTPHPDGPPGRREDSAADAAGDAIAKQIRGSNLLLAGRLLSLVVALLTQLIIVRYLSKTAFGAFAYALSIATVGQTIATFGLDKAISRFVPIYHERGDRAKVLGTIALVATTTAALGAAVIVGVAILHLVLPDSLFQGHDVAPLVLILIALAPIQALDTVVVGLFAAFGRSRAIFFRVYVLTPALRLAVVVATVAAHGGTLTLAAGYVAAAALGSAVFALVLYRVLRSDGLLAGMRLRDVDVPAREILTLTVPLLTTELVGVLISASDTLLLGIFRNTAEVASFAVVRPAAELNELVLVSFSFLYVPLAARLFARNEVEAIDKLYWRTAGWVAVLSFPVFAVTFLLARPLLELLYGARYSGSATFLTILAVGFYAQGASGFNGSMLMVYGRIKSLVVVNGLTVALNLALNLILIPRYGAVGAAVGTTTTYVVFNLVKQLAAAYATSIRFFPREYASVYAAIAVVGSGLAVVRLLEAPLLVEVAAVLAACVVVLGVGLRRLNVAETFPEVGAYGLARFFLRE
jgi:O-antigen/teichoic acid export membrane protein